jgi:hypothetical protein
MNMKVNAFITATVLAFAAQCIAGPLSRPTPFGDPLAVRDPEAAADPRGYERTVTDGYQFGELGRVSGLGPKAKRQDDALPKPTPGPRDPAPVAEPRQDERTVTDGYQFDELDRVGGVSPKLKRGEEDMSPSPVVRSPEPVTAA